MAVAAPLIEVRDAGFQYGDRWIFNGIDLDIRAGEVVTVLGPERLRQEHALALYRRRDGFDTGQRACRGS